VFLEIPNHEFCCEQKALKNYHRLWFIDPGDKNTKIKFNRLAKK
jgi:hypothetical protein